MILLRAEAKYRKIRLSNPTIARCIRDEEGAVETLQMMGWVLEDEEMLMLPEGTAITMKEASSVIVTCWGRGRPPAIVSGSASTDCDCSHRVGH